MNAVTAGATDEFARPASTSWSTTDAGFDAAKQRSDIETALAAKPNVILALPLDPTTSAEAFRQAVDDGAKLVLPLQRARRLQARHGLCRHRHRRPLPDGQAGGRRAGQGDRQKGKVGYIFHDAHYYVTNQRDQAFKTTIEKDYPDIKIVAEQGIADPARAEEIGQRACCSRIPTSTAST